MIQPKRGGHNDGGIVRLKRLILGSIVFMIGIGVSGIGYGIAPNGNGRDLAELGSRGRGIMIRGR